MLAIRRILHPTDFSELCHPAFELACALARDFGAELIVCHVSPPPVTGITDGVVVEIPTGAAEYTMAQLKGITLKDANMKIRHELVRGDPATEIVRLANDNKADLIVMGSHGRSGLSRLLLGSVAEKVLRTAPCPVLTVKTPFQVSLHSNQNSESKRAPCWLD